MLKRNFSLEIEYFNTVPRHGELGKYFITAYMYHGKKKVEAGNTGATFDNRVGLHYDDWDADSQGHLNFADWAAEHHEGLYKYYVLLDRIYTKPEFRGKGLFGIMLKSVLAHFNGSDYFIGLQAVPTSENGSPLLTGDKEELRNKYRKYGFRLCTGDFMHYGNW